MIKLFYIMGKSASGKDTMLKVLLDKLYAIDIKPYVPYTTRPIRKDETPAVDYHFVSEEAMMKFKEDGKVIEMRSYDTDMGVWIYATINDHQFDDNDYIITVGTLESYTKMIEYFSEDKVVPIYITAKDKDRLLRSIDRESKNIYPNYAEVCRRYLEDEKDFSKENLAALGIGENNTFDNYDKILCSYDITEYIINIVRENYNNEN